MPKILTLMALCIGNQL